MESLENKVLFKEYSANSYEEAGELLAKLSKLELVDEVQIIEGFSDENESGVELQILVYPLGMRLAERDKGMFSIPKLHHQLGSSREEFQAEVLHPEVPINVRDKNFAPESSAKRAIRKSLQRVAQVSQTNSETLGQTARPVKQVKDWERRSVAYNKLLIQSRQKMSDVVKNPDATFRQRDDRFRMMHLLQRRGDREVGRLRQREEKS